MTTQTYAATVHGVGAHVVTIEADRNRRGFPLFKIVGLPHKSVAEAKERVRSAIRNAGLSFPRGRITINLSPADVPKYGSGLDLGIALSILALENNALKDGISKGVFIGELALDGSIRPVAGLMAKLLGIDTAVQHIYVPADQAFEAGLAAHILKKRSLHTATHLKDIVSYVVDGSKKHLVAGVSNLSSAKPQILPPIFGQARAKRALEIALAGRHHMLMVGPPGVGKSMIAELARVSQQDIHGDDLHEILKVQSLAGPITELPVRPFRRVHHTISRAGLIGGGNPPTPGEITRAHKGTLLLDEILECARPVLESLRQPLDNGYVSLKRGKYHYTFPADVMVIATANPCPCGYFGHPSKECVCTSSEIARYRKRLSGPLLDRIGMYVYMDPVSLDDLIEKPEYAALDVRSVSEETLSLTSSAETCLDSAYLKFSLSMRGRNKVRDVAQTIAYLDGSTIIKETHIAEALQFREIPFHMN